MEKKSVTCKKCGTSNLFWYKNKNGNWILITRHESDYENGTGRWVEPHKCQQIQAIIESNIEYYEKQIESTKKIGAENGLSQEVINYLVDELQQKLLSLKNL